ncbi:hypothetical protein ONZ51_g6038 [Trametes cubensis]|uniref:Uncharacterized protein n=1 Tax=Trametes cubensis TaxID=1111947 RepID=A0AAD7TSV8_9APHY|nr:hypothetical protein ONZ51_g6038 [Trametes cubensis]
MINTHADFVRAGEAACTADPVLSQELQVRLRYINIINGSIVRWLVKTSKLPGFTGKLAYGYRVGRDKDLVSNATLPPWASYKDGAQILLDKPGSDDDDKDCPGGEGDGGVMDFDEEDGDGIPGVGGAGASGHLLNFVDELE